MLETWVCRACGAPVPVTHRACAYCGAVTERDVPKAPPGAPSLVAPVRTFCPDCGKLYPGEAATCPRCPPLPPDAVASRSVPARCPACGHGMRATALDAVQVDRCDACGGTWFDRGEVGRVLDLRTRGGRDQETAQRLEEHFAPGVPRRDERSRRACVRCRGRMIRRLVASKGTVFVDACPTHGIWFDGGEWESFRAFVAAGGLEVERDREDRGARVRRRRHHFPSDDRSAVSLRALGVLFRTSS